MTTEEDHLEAIDQAIVKAAQVMELADVVDIGDEELSDLYEERHHCGTCEVRTVMEVVWPAIENYIESIKTGALNASNS